MVRDLCLKAASLRQRQSHLATFIIHVEGDFHVLVSDRGCDGDVLAGNETRMSVPFVVGLQGVLL